MSVSTAKCSDHGLAMSDFVNVISYPYIKGVLRGPQLAGHSVETILEKAGLATNLLATKASISGEQFQRLLLTIQEQTQDMFMGFLEQPGKIGLMVEQERARSRAATLGEYTRFSTQFREAVRNDIHYEQHIDHVSQDFTLSVYYKLREGVDPHVFYWHRLMLIYRYYSWLIGKRIKLKQICFATAKPSYCADYQALFSCEVLFDCGRNSLSFDKKYLQYSVIRSPEETADFAANNPDWLVVPGLDRSRRRQVEDVLTSFQRQNIWSPTIAQVAERLSLSQRTLRRQLARENENFQRIKARVRCGLAVKLLVTTDTPITMIANQVGYAEPGDFTRAFVKWMNMTPSAYRVKYQ